MPAVYDKLMILQKTSKERRETIDNLCNKDLPVAEDDVVSQDELKELLKAF